MKKYDFYLVKVKFDGMEMIVKTDKDTTSYSEMKDLYDKTKSKVKEGDVSFIGVNENGYTKIYSKSIEKKEQIDVVMNNLIENLTWLIEYSNKASELESAINMSRDMELKKVELFNDFINDNDDENILSKLNIFEELKEITLLRRRIKYSGILVRKVTSKLNLENILKVLVNATSAIEDNASAKVSKSCVVKEKEYEIKDIFSVEDMNKVIKLKKEYDKICITPTKVICYNLTKHVEDNLNTEQLTISNIEGEILYKAEDVKSENNNLVCIKKQLFTGVQPEHIKNFLKKRVKEFDVISKKDRKVYCYKFESQKNDDIFKCMID